MMKFNRVFLHTGSNLGDRFENMLRVTEVISKRIGNIVQTSSLYETEAWGNVDQPNYLNQAIEVNTYLSPTALLQTALKIETNLGRVRLGKWGSRVMDVDILFYNDLVLSTPTLKIPHPRLHRRNFVLIPMLEIAPDFMHPIFKKTIHSLYIQSKDTLDVSLVEQIKHEE